MGSEMCIRDSPREAFVPEKRRGDAYFNVALPLKWNDQGVLISSLSQPQIVVATLELLAVQPGHRVLEIGTGSGYNTALLSVLVRPCGEVVSIEIEADLAERARSVLRAVGCHGIRILVADGYDGDLHSAPYDRIVVTTGAQDIAPAWVEQLTDRGRLVVPIVDQCSGVGSLFAFEKVEGELHQVAKSRCGFLPIRRL